MLVRVQRATAVTGGGRRGGRLRGRPRSTCSESRSHHLDVQKVTQPLAHSKDGDAEVNGRRRSMRLKKFPG